MSELLNSLLDFLLVEKPNKRIKPHTSCAPTRKPLRALLAAYSRRFAASPGRAAHEPTAPELSFAPAGTYGSVFHLELPVYQPDVGGNLPVTGKNLTQSVRT